VLTAYECRMLPTPASPLSTPGIHARLRLAALCAADCDGRRQRPSAARSVLYMPAEKSEHVPLDLPRCQSGCPSKNYVIHSWLPGNSLIWQSSKCLQIVLSACCRKCVGWSFIWASCCSRCCIWVNGGRCVSRMCQLGGCVGKLSETCRVVICEVVGWRVMVPA